MNGPERDGYQLAGRQDSVIARSQLLATGMTPRTIDHRVETGRLLVLLPGVYAVAGSRLTERSRVRAAALWAGDGAVISHTTAARLLRLDGVTSGSEIHLWVPPGRGKRAERVTLHRGLIEPIDRRFVDGVPLTAPARTLIDCASLLDAESLESALESACHRGLVTVAHVARRLELLGTRGRPGSARLRRLLEIHAGEAPLASSLEVLVARALRGATMPPPRRQWEVIARGRRYRFDFAWPELRVALEADGWRVHGTRLAWKRDVRRLADLASDGWLVEHTDWEEVTRRPAELVTRLRATLATRRRSDRFGA